MRHLQLLGVVFTCTALLAKASADDANTERRLVVGKALPAIVAGAHDWMADNDCVSCHRVTHGAWALNLAVDIPSEVTAEQRRQINAWSTDWSKVANPKVRDEAKPQTTLQNDADTVIQALLGVAAVQNSFEHDWVESYYNALFEGQQEVGFWKPAGQLPLQKRSLRETEEVTTMWVLLALNDLPLTHVKKQEAVGKAQAWLQTDKAVSAGESTEWWALKSLLEDSNSTETNTESTFVRLRSFQNKDGGWGWLINEQSDALGTGLAIYALARNPTAESRQAIDFAQTFLKSTQLEDGSWNVPGTKKTGRKDIAETASYWGTCWAVIGLMQQHEYAKP